MRMHATVAPALLVPAALTLFLATACGGGTGARTTSATAGTATRAAASPTGSPTPAANGVERLPAAEILARARKATLAAKSVRLHGTVREDGEKVGLDFRYSGTDAAVGDVTFSGQRISLVRIGRSVYIKGDDAFWKGVGGAGAVQLLSGKYLRTTPKDRGFRDLANFTTRSKLFAEILSPEGTVRKGKAATVGGAPAVALADGTGGLLYVATLGEPYALRLEGRKEGRIDFDGYGAAVTVQPPPASQVVDVSKLKP
ncbi:hypothetical protein [Actinomadura fibrosa]|uniref:Lipoprotein n=1 Tax=Actinomadura fibrosa TaxID=111802 RepID=A0ABW2XP43_9ACTN|nr:hypothetical protein [Actinomadura fibrosa]